MKLIKYYRHCGQVMAYIKQRLGYGPMMQFALLLPKSSWHKHTQLGGKVFIEVIEYCSGVLNIEEETSKS